MSGALKDEKLNTAIELATYIRCVIGDNLKPDSELAKRLRFIDQQIISTQARAVLALSAINEWEMLPLTSLDVKNNMCVYVFK